MQKSGKIWLVMLLLISAVSTGAQNINTPNKMGPLGTQVNTLTGNLFIPRNDIMIPARGFDINISFNYNSFNYNLQSGFGKGWSFGYSIKYKNDTANSKTIIWGDGREDNYTTLGGSAFKSPNGFFDSLTEYQSGKFRLTELDGTKFTFDNSTHKRVTRMEEPNGNFINFNYTDSLLTSVVNTAGQTISFTYNPAGLLATVVDAIANPTRTYTYTYDAGGNLKQVTDPAAGTNKYTYLINGPMKTITDKNNNTVDIIYYPDFTASELIGCNKRVSFSYDTTNRTTVVTDHLTTGSNQVTQYGYIKFQGQTWLSSIIGNCCGFKMNFEFDANGNKIKETDANGNITTYTYDNRGNMLTRKDPLNQTVTYTYSTNFNNITSFTDAKGFVSTMTYNNAGNLTQLTMPSNLVYTASYNPNGDIISSTDPKGNTFIYIYDSYGNPTNVTGPNGYNATLGFDARGNLLSYIDARGNTSSLEYDILNRLKKIIDPINNNIRLNYDAEGNAVSYINQNNETSLMGYDASNREVELTNTTGKKTYTSYDAMNNITGFTNVLGNSVKFNYDTRNRLIGITDPQGNKTTLNYDAKGNATSVYLPNGETINYTYDPLDRITSANDINGVIAGFAYDRNSNITSYTNGTGANITAEYDSLNRINKITDPLGNSTALTYDRNSNISTVTDRNGITGTYTYDSLNWVKTMTDNNGFIVTLTYDAQGNIVSVKDQNNNITGYTYDNLNRVKRTTYPDNRFLEYTYDNKGNIIVKKLTDGSNINFNYDSLNRITSRTLPGGQIYSYTYDALGRLLTATNSAGSVILAYDALDRVIAETYNGRIVNYSYNIAGRKQTIIYPDSTVITKTFDTRNRLTGISKNADLVVSYQYNNFNQLISKSFANGVTTNMQYDFANRLSNISTANGNFQNLNFTYNSNLNKTSINRLNAPTKSEQFTYDNGNRLTNYKRGIIGGSPIINNTYTYDALGNRTNANLNGSNTVYTINNLNQLTNSNNGMQNINYTYDNNGNLTYDGKYYKTYDAEKRLLKDSSATNNVITYQYDALGRRAQKNNNGSILNYTFSGLQQIEERNGGGVIINKTIFNNYLMPVVNEKNGLAYYYHQNELNSVEVITNAGGRPVEKYEYDVYGKQTIFDSLSNIIPGSITGNRFGYTGQVYDSATASNKFLVREYNPETGLFNERDLIGYADGMGMYQYVHNNPANGVDIFGLEDCDKKAKTTIQEVEIDETYLSNGTTALQLANESKIKSLIAEIDKFNEFINGFGGKRILAWQANIISNRLFNLTKNINALKNFGSGLGAASKLLNTLDLGIKLNTLKNTLFDKNASGYEKTKAGGNAAQSALGFSGIGAIYNLFDFIQEKTLTGSSMNDNAEYAGKYYGDMYYSRENDNAEKEVRSFQIINGDVAKWDIARGKVESRGSHGGRSPAGIKPDCPQNGGGGGTQKPGKPGGGISKPVVILRSSDPNEIIGPDGVPTIHWVSIKDRLPYTILYENSKSASAPAKFVRITSPIESKQDAATFQLGNFGFNSITFAVPPSTFAYYDRLDVRDSLGLYVDITAGYDQINNVAFWEFQSIDPITLLPPTDPLKGFLLLQDSTKPLNGHGFVNFSIKPKQSDITLDSIGARALIVFDTNDTIPTNIFKNTIDALPPTSHMDSLPASTFNPITLSWSGNDDAGGCGIDYYTIYVSTDQVNFTVLIPRISRTDTTLTLPTDSNYCFFVLATDRVGNKEILRQGEIKCVFIGHPLPITWLYFNGVNQGKNNLLNWATASEQNSKQFDVERSLNGINFSRIATVNAIGNSTQTHSYNYTDHNIDLLNSTIMFYRLKEIDYSGISKYSNIVRLNYSKLDKVKSIAYPNPTPGVITILVGDITLVGSYATIFDVNGRLLKKINIIANSQPINLGEFVNGTYFIKLSNEEVFKIVKQ